MTTLMERPATRERKLRVWDPFAGWFDDRDLLFKPFWGELKRRFGGEWAPDIDVFRQGDRMIVQADLPGVRKEDLEVTVDEGLLVIKGTRKSETEVSEEDYYRMERCSGEFYRRVALPFEVPPETVEAHFKDGVLKVEFPVPVEKKARRTQVKVR